MTDKNFNDGDEDIASLKPPLLGAVTPSVASIGPPNSALTAIAIERRVVRVLGHSMRHTGQFHISSTPGKLLVRVHHICCDWRLNFYRPCSFTPLAPPPTERWINRVVKDVKDNSCVSGSDVPQTLTLRNWRFLRANAPEPEQSQFLDIFYLFDIARWPRHLSNTPGASIQRDPTARLRCRDFESVAGHVLHCCDSSSRLQFQSLVSTGTVTGSINPPTSSMMPAVNFSLCQVSNLGTRPGLHLRRFSSLSGESEVRSVSPVVRLWSGTVSDDVPEPSAKSVYKVCHRECFCLSSF